MPGMISSSQMSIGVLSFPGSNCDQDCIYALSRFQHVKVRPIWYRSADLAGLNGIIIPGGFSFGDYLRAGGLAAISPVMNEVKRFVDKGGSVAGICNGFQILTESRLLPGVLLPNQSGKFVCEPVELSIRSEVSGWKDLTKKTVIYPIAHGDGRYHADLETRKMLAGEGRIFAQYRSNPNGSVDDIAGITDGTGRVIGLMPHPERALDGFVGGREDGLEFWTKFVEICS